MFIDWQYAEWQDYGRYGVTLNLPIYFAVWADLE